MKVFIGYDSREPEAAEVCAYSIKSRAKSKTNIHMLKHRELREKGLFWRPWLTESSTGNWRDLIDNKPFSTEFSHTRFLVPHLTGYKGWALFMDSDMIFQTDPQKLFDLVDDKYAVMVVKHEHKPKNGVKMDGREQHAYFRKNWSSFILFNCQHPANAVLTPDYVNSRPGGDLHKFLWLNDYEIGALPKTYNWIEGYSPAEFTPDVIHYTEGGPWFPQCQDVMFADRWIDEYQSMQRNTDGQYFFTPTTKYDFAK